MRVLFFDPTAKYRYTMNTVRGHAMGASESSLMRVAAGLAAEPGYEVSVFQVVDQSRADMVIDGVRHINLHSKIEPDIIVHQRTAKFVADLALEYPKARHIVWMHDLAHESWLRDEPIEGKYVLCVSQFHCRQLVDTWAAMNGGGPAVPFAGGYVYNPVVVDAERQPKVLGRLGFFSSPQKGLSQIVASFYDIKKALPELELVVANPGYLPDVRPDGVTFLGQLSHRRCLEEISKCGALFYPQTTFPETFGVVLAEANAMGVPVLCHDFGAAAEVLLEHNFGHNKVLDCSLPDDVQTALTACLNGQMQPSADPRFELSNVVAEWKKLLEGDA